MQWEKENNIKKLRKKLKAENVGLMSNTAGPKLAPDLC